MGTIADVIEKYQYRTEILAQRPLNEWVIRTPWQDLNRLIGGLYAGKTSVIAGRPAMGKSSILNEIRMAALRQGKQVVSFVLEMGETHLLERMISARLNIPIRDVIELEYLKNPTLRVKADALLRELATYDWYVYGARYTDWLHFQAAALSHLAGGKVNILDVDYVQLLSNSGLGQNRTQELGEMCQEMARWAVAYDTHIIYASQLSRAPEQRRDKRPVLSDLRDSGGVEQAADIVLLLFRPEYYNPGEYEGITEVIVAKHRQGSTGTINLYFDKQRATFFDLEQNGLSIF